MSLSVASIAAQVLARLEADTGSGGLFNVGSPLVTAAEWNQAIQSTQPPYIVYDVALDGPGGEAFKTVGFSATVAFRVVVSRRSVGYAALDRLAAIDARIFGDAGTQSGVPAHGFHRFQITGVSGWTFSQMRFMAQLAESDEDHVSTVTNFQIDAITQTF